MFLPLFYVLLPASAWTVASATPAYGVTHRTYFEPRRVFAGNPNGPTLPTSQGGPRRAVPLRSVKYPPGRSAIPPIDNLWCWETPEDRRRSQTWSPSSARRPAPHPPLAEQWHCPTLVRSGTIGRVTGRSSDEQHLRDLALLRRVRDRMDREFAQPLDVESLARGVNLSAGHLSREFRLAYGESPYAYLMTRRIERAMALLRRGDLSVTEVCFAVGCSSLGTFSTRFAELVGVPPSTFKNQAASPTEGLPSCVAKQVTRPIRNREAPTTDSQIASLA